MDQLSVYNGKEKERLELISDFYNQLSGKFRPMIIDLRFHDRVC